jgi:hypothetical protein
MLSKVRQDYNDLKKNYEILTNSHQEKQKMLNFLNEQKIKNDEIKKQKINSIKSKIIENENKLKNNKPKDFLTKKQKIQQSLDKTEVVLEKIEEKIEKYQDIILLIII